MTAETAETVPEAGDTVAAPPSLLALLDAGLRLELPETGRERTFHLALAGVAFVYVALLSLLLWSGAANPPEPRGQVDGPPSIVAEIVEEPAPDAKSKYSQSGADVPLQPSIMDTPAPPPSPPSAPPAPQVVETPPEPAVQPPPAQPPAQAPPQEKPEAATPPPAPAEAREPAPRTEPIREEPAVEAAPEPVKPDEAKKDAPSKSEPKPTAEAAKPKEAVDPRFADVDVSMDRYAAAVDAAMAERRRQQQARPAPQRPVSPDMSITGGNMRIRGAAKSGRNDEYSRSVIAALIKTKPKPFAIRGSVLVAFEIGPGGALKYVKVLDTSRNTAMDDVALSAIRRAVFGPPPANSTAADLTYIIHYIFD